MKAYTHWFRQQKIYQKIFQTNVVSIVAAILPLVVALFVFEYFSMRAIVLKEIDIKTNIVRDSAAAALAFRDAVTASEALSTLKASPEIEFAYLVLTDNSVLASYSNGRELDAASHFEQFKSTGETLETNQYTISKPLYLRSEPVGTIVVQASLDLFYRQVIYQILFMLIASVVSLCLSLVLSKRFREAITSPLEKLVGFVDEFSRKSDYSARPTVYSNDEIGELSLAFHHMMDTLQERDEKLKKLAFHDYVTGLPNRNYFKERIQDVVRRSLESVIVEDVHDLQVVTKLAQRMIDAVSEDVKIGDNVARVGASIGISLCPDHAEEVSALLMLADAAMYVAKGNSKNTYQVYDRTLR